jgi:hypothetical protein
MVQGAEDGQGGGGTGNFAEKARKSLVIKILTSKALGLKILQGLFAEPAPGKGLRGVGEGGYPPRPGNFPRKTLAGSHLETLACQIFFDSVSQACEESRSRPPRKHRV